MPMALQLFRALRRRLLARETWLCALALSPGSIFVFAKLPPLWRDSDSLGQLTLPPGHFTLLQFPALYPFLCRLPLLLVSGWSRLLAGDSFALDPHARVALNDAGISLLVAAQHLALLLFLALFVVTAAQSFWRRALLVALSLATPLLFLSAQLISSEALGAILILPLATLALLLVRSAEPSRAAWIAFGICLYLNTMTRHVSAVFAALLPLSFLCAFLLRRAAVSPRSFSWGNFRRAVLVGLSAIALAHLTTLGLCLVFGEPYRSIVSRTAIYRFDEIDRLPPIERAAFLKSLQDKSDDPITREAIPRLLEAKGYWSRSLLELDHLIRQHHPPMKPKQRRKLADAYLSEIIGLFYSSAPPLLVESVRTSIFNALTRTTDDDVAKTFLKIGVDSLRWFRADEQMRTATAPLAVCSPEAEARIASFAIPRWLAVANGVPAGLQLLVGLLTALALFFSRRLPQWRLLPLGGIFLTNILLMSGTFLISPYAERQVLPECILAFVSVAILLGGAGRPCEE